MTGNIISHIEAFLKRYVTFPSDQPGYSFVAALWAAGTYGFPQPTKVTEEEAEKLGQAAGSYKIPRPAFDAFPYLVVTSSTKRSGKTRFGIDLLSMLCNRSKKITGASAASFYHYIRNLCPTLLNDESEMMSGEGASVMKSAVNAGYKIGQTVPRVNGEEIQEWPVYCPKVFVLIGDVFDTLRDRSIVFTMRRAEPAERYVEERAAAEAEPIRLQLESIMKARYQEIRDTYKAHKGLDFLQDRDEEIWTPLFVLCSILAPDRVEELTRIAVDMATEKTAPARRFTTLLREGAESAAEDDEYSKRLVVDFASIYRRNETKLFTQDALDRLYEIPTAPWRKFRGTGLTPMNLADYMSRHGVEPKLVRIGGRKENGGDVKRGYNKADVLRAARALHA